MKPTEIVAVANQKGGVGKTTTSVNLAAGVAQLGFPVLLVDLDPQANATSSLGIPPTKGGSIYDVLLGEGRAENRILATAVERLSILPSELDLAGAEVDIARMDAYLTTLRRALQPILETNRYRFIILDCPPSLGILTMNALAAAHAVLVPMQCEYFALEGLNVIHRLVQKLRESGANSALRIEGLVMTMYDGRTNLSSDVVNEVSRHFPNEVYQTVIPRNVRLAEAPSHGKPIFLYDRYSAGAKAYLDLSREFLDRRHETYQPPPPPVRKISLFRLQRSGSSLSDELTHS